MKKAAIMGLLILAIPAEAETRREWNPPKEYDHAFVGELIVERLPPEKIVARCRELLSDLPWIELPEKLLGCARHNEEKTFCTIVIPSRITRGVRPSAVIRHEVGHCNGWSHDHD